jgi:hypothetical protein
MTSPALLDLADRARTRTEAEARADHQAWLLKGAIRCWQDMKALHPDDEDAALEGLYAACIEKCGGSEVLGTNLAREAVWARTSEIFAQLRNDDTVTQ